MIAPGKYAGAAQILRFNWPWYALALGVNVASGIVIAYRLVGPRTTFVAGAFLILSDYWLIASIVASHFIYDLSAVSRAGWLDDIQTEGVRRVGIFHAGHDEASAAVRARFPEAETMAFDFFDSGAPVEASLLRARRESSGGATPIGRGPIPLPDAVLDLACVVFAAHEIREETARAAFFRELGRVVAPSGRIVVVEHLRDVANFSVYGPGFLHFLPDAAWRRTFASAGLSARDTACTPFVRVFILSIGART